MKKDRDTITKAEPDLFTMLVDRYYPLLDRMVRDENSEVTRRALKRARTLFEICVNQIKCNDEDVYADSIDWDATGGSPKVVNLEKKKGKGGDSTHAGTDL